MPVNPPMARPTAAAPLIALSSDFIRTKEYLEAIVASTSDAICTTDTRGRVIYFSPGAESMVGYTSAEMMGRHAHQLYAGGREEAELIMQALRKQGSIQNHETVFKAKDGRSIHVSMSASLLRNRSGQVIGTLGISKDITSRVELETRLRELSITDSLTGLYNHRHFQERLSQEASRARRQRYELSMILLDLDGFKQANDLWGHLEGDRILKEFASVLQQSIRSEMDSVYRYGGDEFVVLLPGLGAGRAEKVARRIASSAAQKMPQRGVGVSYGVATLPPAGPLSRLIKTADRRMFVMKAARRRAPHRAAPSLNAPRGV